MVVVGGVRIKKDIHQSVKDQQKKLFLLFNKLNDFL